MPAPIFPAKPTSCGRPLMNLDACILGETGQKLPVGEMGEICLHGANIMKEYWGKLDKTAEVFHIDESEKLWFRSGDLGWMSKDLYISWTALRTSSFVEVKIFLAQRLKPL